VDLLKAVPNCTSAAKGKQLDARGALAIKRAKQFTKFAIPFVKIS
jgi:hypothetical protein